MTPAPKAWRRSNDVLWRNLAGVTVLLATDLDDPIVLRGAASLVWLALAEPGTEADLNSDVLSVAPDTSPDDLYHALHFLHEEGLVTESPS